MSKLTLATLGNISNTTDVNAINSNSDLTETAVENTLSRDGTQPNTMGSNLDMNQYRVINLPAPITANEPLRLTDYQTLSGGGSISVNALPAGGTAGQVLRKNSGTNFDATWSRLAITNPANAATLTIADNKTVVVNNSLTLAGTDATTVTFQATDTYVGRATTDTLTNKTFDTAGAGNVFKINGTQITAKTGTGSAVLATSPTLVTPVLGAATGTSLAATGAITSSSPSTGIGYATGAGNTVTQATNKTTGVTINANTGAITTNNASLASATTVTFQVTNSAVGATDLILTTHESGGTISAYTINMYPTSAGFANCTIRNNTGGALGEAMVIRFAIIKSVNT